MGKNDLQFGVMLLVILVLFFALLGQTAKLASQEALLDHEFRRGWESWQEHGYYWYNSTCTDIQGYGAENDTPTNVSMSFCGKMWDARDTLEPKNVNVVNAAWVSNSTNVTMMNMSLVNGSWEPVCNRTRVTQYGVVVYDSGCKPEPDT